MVYVIMRMNAKNLRQTKEVANHSSHLNRDWLDESDSDEEQSYAMMAKLEDASPTAEKGTSKCL